MLRDKLRVFVSHISPPLGPQVTFSKSNFRDLKIIS